MIFFKFLCPTIFFAKDEKNGVNIEHRKAETYQLLKPNVKQKCGSENENSSIWPAIACVVKKAEALGFLLQLMRYARALYSIVHAKEGLYNFFPKETANHIHGELFRRLEVCTFEDERKIIRFLNIISQFCDFFIARMIF